jgi:hypothetical protein
MSNKETTLKEKFKLALTSTAKVISDDFELNSKSSDKKKQKELNTIEIEDLNNESSFGLSDGYLDATISRAAEGLKEGDSIKVDAVEYAAAGKDDTLTVFANDEPLRIEKFRIELAAGTGI